MKVSGKNYRTIWQCDINKEVVKIIDQRLLPHEFSIIDLVTYTDAINAISDMAVRGAPLIGGTAAWGMFLAAVEMKNKNLGIEFILKAAKEISESRPTAVNLIWAVNRIAEKVENLDDRDSIVSIIEKEATDICNEDAENCKRIGEHGLELIREISLRKAGEPVNILTHCNAGWLATIDNGTATAPIYAARDHGVDIHVWVDETRPRNQGASLTSWELLHEDISHTLIVDNAGGHLMQHGFVDICIIGSDRTTRTGDVCNKIGTYLKALAAKDNNIPFFVALPHSTIDWSIRDGLREIPIEERDPEEVSHIYGLSNNSLERVKITPDQTKCSNYAFDVTPRKYISGLITPRGICDANESDISRLYPEF
ncbi:S-methyl-5-thioribose-1-phosphate isomerase [Gammaproteobacteria bacterium]|nr:S-methyl-5-thioribose-1-phosphate isomerase [Gammaproteobacteria bacterium]